jgi:hypothetical protein
MARMKTIALVLQALATALVMNNIRLWTYRRADPLSPPAAGHLAHRRPRLVSDD